MKKTFDALFPFEGYRAYLRISKSKKTKVFGRRIIGLYSSEKTPHRITMSYARYLVCVREKRILKKEEHVDHDDADKTNDKPDNLKILSQSENNKKSIRDRGISLLMVEMKCPSCEETFIKPKHKTFLIKGGLYATCSKECKYIFQMLRYTKPRKKKIGINQVIKFFRSNENNKQRK